MRMKGKVLITFMIKKCSGVSVIEGVRDINQSHPGIFDIWSHIDRRQKIIASTMLSSSGTLFVIG